MFISHFKTGIQPIVEQVASDHKKVDRTLGQIAADGEKLKAVVAQNAASAVDLLINASYTFAEGK